MGIATQGKNLVVSYDHPGVKIISKEGAMIENLDNATAGEEVFEKPRWITTAIDDSIYVTDWGTHKVIRLDSRLTILQTFSGPMPNAPCGIIALNRDQLLVCSFHNNSIVLIRPSLDNKKVILETQHGIEKPYSICYCREKRFFTLRKMETRFVSISCPNYI